MPIRSSFLAASVLAAVLTPAGSNASTAQAWEEFRRDVETACREAGTTVIEAPSVVVDPFGLQSYGLALLSGRSTEDGTEQALICVYDKATRAVEIGGTMALESAVPALRPEAGTIAATAAEETSTARLLSPTALDASADPTEGGEGEQGLLLSGLCDASCSVMLAELADADRAELLALAGQISRTVDASEGTAPSGGASEARAAAEAAAATVRGEGGQTLLPITEAEEGARSCTLYYFGYEGETSRTVGTHQCAVTRADDGTLVVEKTSGERLRAEIRPLVGSVSAFVGRTFEAGDPDERYDRASPESARSPEFGNTVGFAARSEGDLVLVSSQRRRFDASDSFFWVLQLDGS